jgi:hypothetical protein
MVLYGVFGSHSPEACPRNNPANRKLVIQISEKLTELAQENHVELKEQFHSALEHNFCRKWSYSPEIYGRVRMGKVSYHEDIPHWNVQDVG